MCDQFIMLLHIFFFVALVSISTAATHSCQLNIAHTLNERSLSQYPLSLDQKLQVKMIQDGLKSNKQKILRVDDLYKREPLVATAILIDGHSVTPIDFDLESQIPQDLPNAGEAILVLDDASAVNESCQTEVAVARRIPQHLVDTANRLHADISSGMLERCASDDSVQRNFQAIPRPHTRRIQPTSAAVHREIMDIMQVSVDSIQEQRTRSLKCAARTSLGIGILLFAFIIVFWH